VKKDGDVPPGHQMARVEDLELTRGWKKDDEGHPELLTAQGG